MHPTNTVHSQILSSDDINTKEIEWDEMDKEFKREKKWIICNNKQAKRSILASYKTLTL